MSFDNAFFAAPGNEFYSNKEDEFKGPCMNTSQDPFGTLNWTSPNVINHRTFVPFLQPAIPLHGNDFVGAWSSLLPNPDLAIPGAGAFDFSLLNSTLLNPSFVLSEASTPGLYAGNYLGSPATANEFFLADNGTMPTFGHLEFPPVGPSPALPQTGNQQVDTACISALMEILAPSMGGMYGESVSAPAPMPEVFPQTPSYSTAATANTKKVSRAKGKTRSYASRSVSTRLTEPKPPSAGGKTYTCCNEACGRILTTERSYKRHQLTHCTNTYFCANPRCWTNTTKKDRGVGRLYSMRRHLNDRLHGKLGEQHPCVLAARTLGWTGKDCTEDYLKRDGPPPLE